MHDRDAAAATLWQLKGLGVRIAIDDFGTGYSSLAYLRRFPIDMLKVAREFVDGLGRDAHDDVITRAIVELANTLGLLTVAEGIETTQQSETVAALGCDIAQGYLFSRPIEADAVSAVMVLARPSSEVIRCDPASRGRPADGARLGELSAGQAAGTSPAASISSACSRHHGDQASSPSVSCRARKAAQSSSSHSPTSVGSGAGDPGEPAQVDRADLVLHDAPELRAVAVAGQGRRRSVTSRPSSNRAAGRSRRRRPRPAPGDRTPCWSTCPGTSACPPPGG